MKLKNHIAHSLLTSNTISEHLVEVFFNEARRNGGCFAFPTENYIPKEGVFFVEGEQLKEVVNTATELTDTSDLEIPYFVTQTVLNSLSYIKITENDLASYLDTKTCYDWSLFKDVSNQKLTFILPNNHVIRILVRYGHILFLDLKYGKDGILTHQVNCVNPISLIGTFNPNIQRAYDEDWMPYRDPKTLGEESEEYHKFIYKFMLFFFLSDHSIHIVPPKGRYGTRKHNKIINSLEIPIKIPVVDKNWNVTSIRFEGFNVSGHVRLQPCGEGNLQRKLIFIKPFRKNGYVKRAKNNKK